MTGLAVFLGILGYFWTPYSTTAMSAAEKFTAPSMHHIFGTDNFGRDIFSRVMQGLGTTLVISTSVVLFSTVAGVLLGAFTGYFGGILDEILMRITDAVNGFPSILLTLVIISWKRQAECDHRTWDRIYPKLCADCPWRVFMSS